MLSFILTFSPDECQSKSFEKMECTVQVKCRARVQFVHKTFLPEIKKELHRKKLFYFQFLLIIFVNIFSNDGLIIRKRTSVELIQRFCDEKRR